MKNISNELQEHLQQDVTSMATCWKVTRRDEVVMGFTDHDQSLQIDGVCYWAASGFTPSSVMSSSALNVDDLDVQGLLDDEAITREDILAGLYDYAEISVFMVNYEDVSQGVLLLRTGWLGEVRLQHDQFVAEVRGLTQHLSQTIGALYAPACRAKLGDARCKVEMDDYTVSGVVSAVSSQSLFTDGLRSEGPGYFAYGTVRFTSGANAGFSMEIKEYSGGNFVLALPMPYASRR